MSGGFWQGGFCPGVYVRGGFVLEPVWGSWFIFALHWAGKVVYAYFPLGDLFSGLLPTGGEGGLHENSPLGEWVGLYVYFPLG